MPFSSESNVMGIWLIWFIVAIGVIATKFYTARTVTHINLKLAEREKYLANIKLENKTLKSNRYFVKSCVKSDRGHTGTFRNWTVWSTA
jgi:hypothetical protein